MSFVMLVGSDGRFDFSQWPWFEWGNHSRHRGGWRGARALYCGLLLLSGGV